MKKKIINFLSLKKINLEFKREFQNVLKRVLNNGNLLLSKETENFEKDFAKYCGAKYAVAVSNGLDALRLVLMAKKIGPGDEVIVPYNTHISTWMSVTHVGATIVPVEPYINTYNINVSLIEKAITKKTKAIIPVHLYGQPASILNIVKLAKKYGIFVLEDASQAHGATYQGIKTGAWGGAAAFSLYPTKNLGALGDSGIITTNSKKLYLILKSLRNYGSPKKNYFTHIGLNARIDELQSGFLRIKLKNLDKYNAYRSKIADYYLKKLMDINEIVLPFIDNNVKSVWHLFVIRVKNNKRNKLLNYLLNSNIQTMIHYPTPPHLQPAYKFMNLKKKTSIVTEKISKELLSLPIDQSLKLKDYEKIINTIKFFFKKKN
jgi:dTDP-4-amino-4,6-dideoxygalactose transaminase